VKLFERFRYEREAGQHYRALRATGLTHEEAVEGVREHMQTTYGASPDWSAILDIVIQILQMLRLLFNR
jgi:hypothetical protein